MGEKNLFIQNGKKSECFYPQLWRRHKTVPYHEQPLEVHLQLQWCQAAEGGSFAAAAEGNQVAAEGGHIAAGGRQVAALGSSAAVAGGSQEDRKAAVVGSFAAAQRSPAAAAVEGNH